jgi:hypothetical protein
MEKPSARGPSPSRNPESFRGERKIESKSKAPFPVRKITKREPRD